MCEDLYEQAPVQLKSRVQQVVGMAEVGVDLSWAEVGKEKGQPLPETHPLVRTERSVWEVRAASRILLSNLEDLQLHKSLIKRMKILVNSFSELSNILVEAGEEKAASSNLNLSRSTSFMRDDTAKAGLSFRSIYNPAKSKLLADSLRLVYL